MSSITINLFQIYETTDQQAYQPVYQQAYQPVYGLIKDTNIINPTICQKDFAGFAILNSSTITLFHNSLPMNASRIRARIKDKRTAIVSAYTSRFWVGGVSEKPSTAARHADWIADISTILGKQFIAFHIEVHLLRLSYDAQ